MDRRRILIASFTSWYHYLGICSYLRFHADQFDTVYFVAQFFYGKKNKVNIELSKQYAKKVFLINDLKDLDRVLGEHDLRFFKITIASSSNVPYRLSRIVRKHSGSFDIVCYEEGIGSYSNLFRHINTKVREGPTKSHVLRLTRYLFYYISWLYKYIIFYKVKKKYWLMFDKKTLLVNYDVVEAFKGVISDQKLIGSQNYPLPENSTLLISSPFSELGFISETSYLENLSLIFGNSDKVYVKPHPIENTNKYKNLGYNIINTDLPYEIWAKSLHESVDVYAFSSTCIYTSRLIYKLEVYRISSLDFFYNTFSSHQRKIIDKYSTVVDGRH